MKQLPLVAALALAITAAATPALADSIAIGGDNAWHPFAVDSLLAPLATPLRWIDDSGALRTFTFSVGAGQSAQLTVLDLDFAGDTFSVFSNGALLGNTSAVPIGSLESSADAGFDFAAALANNSFSRGVFIFSPGSYTIGGSLLQSATFGGVPIEATGGAVRLAFVTAPVPEPETISLLLGGFIALGALMRRRGLGR